jgi:hypothetical protein
MRPRYRRAREGKAAAKQTERLAFYILPVARVKERSQTTEANHGND